MNNNRGLKYSIHYYCREKYYQTAETIALEGIKLYSDDNSFRLYWCFSLVLSGRFQESIRELETLLNSNDVNIGAILALIWAHKTSQVNDKDSIALLENKLKVERKKATNSALYYGSLFLYFNEKISKAYEYLDRFLKDNPNSNDGLVLKGWLEVASTKASHYKVAYNCFNAAIESDKENLDASLGLVKIKEKENDLTSGLALLNQLIVKFPSIMAPLIEKMKIQLASNDWDVAVETANRILALSGNHIEAIKVRAVALLCRDGNYNEASACLKELSHEIGKSEKQNSLIYYLNAQLFSYLSGKNIKVLMETYNLAEKAAQLDPSNADFLTELGYQNVLQGNYKEAAKFFRNSTKLDDSSISALTGLTLCQIEEGGGINDQIKQQVEFLREIQCDQPSPELLLMSAKLADGSPEALSFLNQAVKVHFNNFKRHPFGIDYLFHLNPVFLMQLAHEFMRFVPSKSPDSPQGEKMPDALSKGLMILQELIDSCPGLIEAQYAFAQAQFLIGNLKKAKQTLTYILEELDPAFLSAHVFMAEILFVEKNFQEGTQCLEAGLSYNFKIREYPIYHMTMAMIFKQNGHLGDCIKSLQAALSAADKLEHASTNGTWLMPSNNSKTTLYLELIDAYRENGEAAEAMKLIECALAVFKGTPEENRIIIANAQLLIQQGNVTEGFDMLKRIGPNQNYYILAKKTMARVYLVSKKDREMFVECYKDIVVNFPSAETYSMLGDAYLSIQEAHLAIEAYEETLKTNPKDVNLVSKLGKALIKTHHFSKAINYYKDAIQNERNLDLIYDLGELYFKLGELDNAERILVTEMESDGIESLDRLSSKTRVWQLLAKIREKSGNLSESLRALKVAKENHVLAGKGVANQSKEHKERLCSICSDMAVLLTRLRDFNGAIRCYKESLTIKPGDPKVLIAISRLYLQMNEFEECQNTSKRLLAADPNSEPAVVMLADLAFRKVDFEAAAFHFKQLLTRKPTFWTALARLIEVMRRSGNLEDAIPFLERAENSLVQPLEDPGYFYCKGLYERYSERPGPAIQHFNRARRHSDWGQKAHFHMIEICLNPENETLRSEAFAGETERGEEEGHDSKEIALKTAQRLLSELNNQTGSREAFTQRLLENFWLLATNQRGNIEKAQQDFAILAAHDLYKDNVAVALGMGISYVLQKQIQKAKNQLKRIIKNEWNYEDAEYLERAWLLLTDIYVQAGKTDAPVELIQKILLHNKSCYKAYDYAGVIAEKEQLHKDAAVQYEKAWRYCSQTNPAIGYKLAFNYLKGKKYADAIEVCYAILKSHPDYPRIQKEILEKAKNHLRT